MDDDDEDSERDRSPEEPKPEPTEPSTSETKGITGYYTYRNVYESLLERGELS